MLNFLFILNFEFYSKNEKVVIKDLDKLSKIFDFKRISFESYVAYFDKSYFLKINNFNDLNCILNQY